jgi:hypothetical protein
MGEIKKICKSCGAEKILGQFYDDKSKKYGKSSLCKDCKCKQEKNYREENSDMLKERKKAYYQKNSEELKNKAKKRRDVNLEKSREYDRKKREKKEKRKLYLKKNKEKINIRVRDYSKRRGQDPAVKLRRSVSKSIYKALKSNNLSKGKKSSFDYLDYTAEELLYHIKSFFILPGNEWMNAENQGAYVANTWNDNDSSTWKWQLDHIIPQSDLPYVSMEDENFKICWALGNLRPLSAKQNWLDGANRTRHKKKNI